MLQFHFDTDKKRYKSFELPGAKPHYNPDKPGQVEHIFLNLSLDISNQICFGDCSISLLPIRNHIDRLVLDAVNLKIKSVLINEIEQKFEHDGKKLYIYLSEATQCGKRLLLAIAYSVEKPQRGIYFIQPDKYYPHKPTQVWTQGEDEDSRYWFPCFDYPGQLSTSEIRIRVPKPLMAISNGELIDTLEDGNHQIYHWVQKQVHPTYLMTLAVSDFSEIKQGWQDKTISYYVEKGREADAERSLGKTPRMVEFLSQSYGYIYPYPKYAQVCVDDFIFGGMENTSTTLLTDRCLLDERSLLDNRNTESLVVHELAHQWFGDLLVIKHWSHAWIKEGMASYSEVMWTEHEYGPEEAAYYRLLEARSYLNEDSHRYRRPMVTHVYREAIELYDRHIYEKGSCVYHMIRAELGEELFWQAIHTFVQDYAHQTVETIDLLRSIEKATGRNLSFLFDQYVYRGGHPDFKITYFWDGDVNLAKLTVTQTQASDERDLFDLKIPIGFGYRAEKSPLKTFTVRINEREQSFYFPLGEKPDFISFDVGNNFLKTVVLEYPLPELKAQLEGDPHPVSRIYAAEALAKKGGWEVVQALSNALQNDPFWGVRAEVAKNLAEVKLDQVFDSLVSGLGDTSPFVRLAVVESLSQIKTYSSYQAVKELVEKGDQSYYVEAAACQSLGLISATNLDENIDEDTTINLLASVLQSRAGWNEIVRSGAIAGLSQFKTSEAALNLVLEYSKLGVSQALRLSAIRALGKISLGQSSANLERILGQLGEIAKETFFLTQIAVITALGKMETPKAIGILQSLADQTSDGRVRRYAQEEIPKVQKHIGPEKSLRHMREELDQLKQQNQELRSRLENLEAKSKIVGKQE
ncbi:M1 family metallopeptidase [Cylindrospermopsis raciborskii]|uniref:M1 family metallopeptidase n=1 Tax=Cylindrospermopsis raciborskii TaxID=77022 RepID=UPI000E1F01BC|nr:M1 family metallopeptidase [Cylindrospermopsis raciborskii]UJL32650.1 M1 family metallopeptidase [Cylindrospermopsis raciborskii Cr2010]